VFGLFPMKATLGMKGHLGIKVKRANPSRTRLIDFFNRLLGRYTT
jgi:hypothetical protein